MSTYDPSDDAAAPTIAAIYIDRESAHDALDGLHRAGFRRVWLGVTRTDTTAADEPLVEPDNAGGFMEALGRFFSGDASRAGTLHDALVRHGLDEAQARRIDAEIDPGNAVVLVDGEYDPAQATRILETSGGALVPQSDRGAAGDSRRLELREERLALDKERVRSGEARVGTDVVTQQASVDVPVFHEELYIERRPVSEARAGAPETPIGQGQEIRVPLNAERLDVSKATVVAEEVTVGKRRVEGIEHVNETVRREELRVDDPANSTTRVRDDAPLGDR